MDFFAEEYGVIVFQPTISRVLADMKISRKKVDICATFTLNHNISLESLLIGVAENEAG